MDTLVKKKFLKTKFNNEGVNFRSPYTSIYFPANIKSYPSKNIEYLEKTINTFLDDYDNIYYKGATSTAFVEENKSQ